MSDYSLKELVLMLQGAVSKIDQFMSDNHEQHIDMNNTLKEHNGRLKKSEQWQERIMGGFVVASMLVIPFMGWYIYYTQQLLGQAVEAKTEVNELKTKVEAISR